LTPTAAETSAKRAPIVGIGPSLWPSGGTVWGRECLADADNAGHTADTPATDWAKDRPTRPRAEERVSFPHRTRTRSAKQTGRSAAARILGAPAAAPAPRAASAVPARPARHGESGPVATAVAGVASRSGRPTSLVGAMPVPEAEPTGARAAATMRSRNRPVQGSARSCTPTGSPFGRVGTDLGVHPKDHGEQERRPPKQQTLNARADPVEGERAGLRSALRCGRGSHPHQLTRNCATRAAFGTGCRQRHGPHPTAGPGSHVAVTGD
jgi:hypothetical protein